MKRFIKFILLAILVLPIWLTIVAFGDGLNNLQGEWKSKLNDELLKLKTRKIQITDMSAKDLPPLPVVGDAIALDTSKLRANGFSFLSVQNLDAQGRITKIYRFQVKAYIQDLVPLASRYLERGTTLRSGDLKWEWREAGNSQGDLAGQSDLEGRSLRVALNAGDLVSLSKTEAENLVKKGDRVTVIVAGGGIKVSGVGVAEQSGSRGQSVKILNLDSKKEIVGIVTGERTVEVGI